MTDFQVVTDHRTSYPHSVELKAGDYVVVTAETEGGWVWCICPDGRGAWVPQDYLVRHGAKGRARFDYSSAELTAQVGDRLSCSQEAGGWLWCVNPNGESGWIPKLKLRKL